MPEIAASSSLALGSGGMPVVRVLGQSFSNWPLVTLEVRELLVFFFGGVDRQGLSVYYGMFTNIPDFHKMPEVPLPLVVTTKMIFRDFKRRCLLEAPSCPCGESLQIITLTNDLFYWHM